MNQLRMQVRLLVAFNGRQRVLEELASAEGLDLATVERELEQVRGSVGRKSATARKARRRRPALDLLRDLTLDNAVRPTVEKLVIAYEAKGFLRELWRVRQFLESHGVAASGVRSRNDALRKVIGVLSDLPRDKLEQLAAELANGESDLSILTDQILGPAGGRRHKPGGPAVQALR